jgi:hypothetical protein
MLYWHRSKNTHKRSFVQVTVMKYLSPSGFDITKQGGVIPSEFCSDYAHAGRVAAENDSCIRLALSQMGGTTPITSHPQQTRRDA